MKISSYKLTELPRVAAQIVDQIDSKVVLIVGSMGSGKTTLIKAICKSLGVEDEVSSPTFALVNEYLDKKGDSIFHFDLYRLDNPTQALDIGIEEYFESKCLCLVEWPEKLANFLPSNFGVITITENASSRSLEFAANCTQENRPNLEADFL